MSEASKQSTQLRERLALKIAPWLGRRWEPQWDEALADLAEVAYGARDAIWTSPRVLVDKALERTREQESGRYFLGRMP